ncbi:MAG TPA: ATP-binding protein [Planctomycetota bacterium]|nr:ATP-binding protein [Planctomycetota bacterium]
MKVIDQRLAPFCALVGPNASGKSTFLDTIGFLSDLIRNRGDVLETVKMRSSSFEKLLWMGEGNSFELAVEAKIPETLIARMMPEKQQFASVRYEVEIGFDRDQNEVGLNHETLWLMVPGRPPAPRPAQQQFPFAREDSGSILLKPGRGLQTTITKTPNGNDNYYAHGRKSFRPSFKVGRGRSALANNPADTESFPVSAWFRELLETGVQTFMLNSQTIRQPSAPGQGRRFLTDGSNLPWVVAELRKDTKRFNAWLAHVRTALEDVKDIDTIERPEDKHRYLVIEYASGVKVPSWLVSDGTLRLLTLTIPAYIADLEGIFLIEEPENGIHPRAIETVLQSVSSMYRSQVLMATHSPIALNMLKPEDVLCFAKDKDGATDVVAGNEHPALREWKSGAPELGVLFATGILS